MSQLHYLGFFSIILHLLLAHVYYSLGFHMKNDVMAGRKVINNGAPSQSGLGGYCLRIDEPRDKVSFMKQKTEPVLKQNPGIKADLV
jgi:hypothetical protein